MAAPVLGGILVGRGRVGFCQNQQLFGVGRLIVDLNAHVIDHADDALDVLGIQHVVGQVIVDFSVGQVAARFAQLDQRLELLAAGLKLFFRTALLRSSEFLEQGLFLGLAVTGLQLFGFRCRSGGSAWRR